MYTTEVYQIKKNHELYKYCKEHCEKAKFLRNAVVYRYRQIMLASWKNFKDLSPQQIEVIAEFSRGNDKFKPIGEKNYIPSYNQMDYVMKVNKNPDYFSGLPKQSVQQIERRVLQDFKNWMASVKKYNQCPIGYSGRPRMPGYTKEEQTSFVITNQDAVIYQSESQYVLKLPLTKKRLALGSMVSGRLKQVEIKPYYDIYKICVIYETEEFADKVLDKNRILALDLGINNFLASSNNCGLKPFIVKGRAMKSKNVHVMKETARLQSELMKPQQGQYTSKRLQRLWRKRHNYFKDFASKVSSYLTQYCIKNDIGTVIVGKSRDWKQGADMDKTNNKMVRLIPFAEILAQIKGKLESHGIQYIETEESYTSKASFLDNDRIPVYGDKDIPTFSGNRIYRGLYKSKNGICINADVNGASNILRKCFPDAFKKVSDFSYLYRSVEVVNLV